MASFSTADVVAVAEFRAALRQFLRTTERVARRSGLTPQRYLLLLMIKGAPTGTSVDRDRAGRAASACPEHRDGLVSRAIDTGLVDREQSVLDARVAHLRLTDEGERRLARAFTTLAAERSNVRQAFAHLDAELPS